ncbi:MAG: 4-hydroxy-3-methylbut-2-enyl diphosphate reductase [Candidatus Latescibacteria bacterium]|nr:4-hydroxy-3-methylbut-2-enyl diphosphate reductase [Candidatus Latescibacterota bacterium]
MARKFEIPEFYKSPIISQVKRSRQLSDPKKRDLQPSVLDFGPVRFFLARHFGFCFGVENAIEIAYKTLEAHSDRRVFFLSEMIHNPNVNADLQDRGVQFMFTPSGQQLIPWDELVPEDIVVVPAFGTTVGTQEELSRRGIDPYQYNTTCPFVEKVWKRSAQLGDGDYTVVIHGKTIHEETRATFSHAVQNAQVVAILNLKEARILADIIRGKRDLNAFEQYFRHKCSQGFDPGIHLSRIGVVNQTTMLATETREIAGIIRQALIDRYGEKNIGDHFADTSDTLCYATNENQNATYTLIEQDADLALVVGGYNSSNTSHIVELCEEAMPTFFVKDAEELISERTIRHYCLKSHGVEIAENWLPDKRPVDIALTCGASCPDAVVDGVLLRVLCFFSGARDVEDVLASYRAMEPV